VDLKLERVQRRSDGIFSHLLDDKDNIIAYTLEHAYEQDGQYSPKIPNGEFKCVRGQHRLHGMTEDFTTFEITGIEGHSNLLFHWGNYNKDSEGCVLVGDAIIDSSGSEMITHSRATFEKFMELEQGLDFFTLTVS
jgi:hypothetical protein